MRRRMKKTTRQYILVIFVLVLVLASGILLTLRYLAYGIKSTYTALLDERDGIIEQNTRQVYTAAFDIRAGERIDESATLVITTLSSQDAALFLTEEDLGKEALLDIPAGTHLTKAMVNESGMVQGLREMSYRVIEISNNIENNDTIDVRIRYPNGEDYIVLAGKRIRLAEGDQSSCYLWVSEEEILLMSAAVVDAYLYTGASIYANRYIEPSIQEKSIVTYVPGEELMTLIYQDPNVIRIASENLSGELRKELESRMDGKTGVMQYE